MGQRPIAKLGIRARFSPKRSSRFHRLIPASALGRKILDLHNSYKIAAIASGNLDAERRGNDVNHGIAREYHVADETGC
jgi:hypothetical protein